MIQIRLVFPPALFLPASKHCIHPHLRLESRYATLSEKVLCQFLSGPALNASSEQCEPNTTSYRDSESMTDNEDMAETLAAMQVPEHIFDFVN